MDKNIEDLIHSTIAVADIEDLNIFLLTMHAILNKNTHTTRSWLSYDQVDLNTIKYDLFCIDLEELENISSKILKKFSLCENTINNLTSIKKTEISLICENALSNINGSGEVIYEFARLTPFCNDNIYNLFVKNYSINNDNIVNVLKLRNKKIKEIQKKYKDDNIYNNSFQTLWHKSIQEKIELEWQRVWGPTNIYIDTLHIAME